MRLAVATEAHLLRDREGVVRAESEGRAYAFWQRYLSEFDDVLVIARVSPLHDAAGPVVEGQGVRVVALPGRSGLLGAMRSFLRSRRVTEDLVAQRCAFVARVPGALGSGLARAARRAGRPYGLEVVGDPHEVLRTIGLPGSVARVLGHLAMRQLRWDCERATAVSYVTTSTLQRLYPPAPEAFTTSYSSVALPDASFAVLSRRFDAPPSAPRIVTVGAQAQRYKGHHVLLDAIPLLRSAHRLEVHCVLVGDGRHRAALEEQAAALGVAAFVTFTGRLSTGEAVRRALDDADLFVLPSLTEGLPRALLEAMARGMPCVASDVGGVRELLPPEDCFPAGNARALAASVARALGDVTRLNAMAKRNLETARDYAEDRLSARRAEFLRELRRRSDH